MPTRPAMDQKDSLVDGVLLIAFDSPHLAEALALLGGRIHRSRIATFLVSSDDGDAPSISGIESFVPGIEPQGGHIYSCTWSGRDAQTQTAACASAGVASVEEFLIQLPQKHRSSSALVMLSPLESHHLSVLRSVYESDGIVVTLHAPSQSLPLWLECCANMDDLEALLVQFFKHSEKLFPLHIEKALDIDQIFDLLQHHHQADFRFYKRTTIFRRIERRMGLRSIDTIAVYVELLRSNSQELSALFKDLLIGVTEFFRDPQLWDYVKSEVLIPLINASSSQDALRIWVPGCSTGEEAYTLAILVQECLSELRKPKPVQIFASDIEEDSINYARAGYYDVESLAHIPPRIVERYFQQDLRGMRIRREIRETVVFAVQNLLANAPFSNLDLISCRNLLIYLENPIQKKVISLFHYVLKPGSFLILGGSENIASQDELFEPVSKEHRVYTAKASAPHARLSIPLVSTLGRPQPGAAHKPHVQQKSLTQVFTSELLRRFAPASIVMNKKFEILHFNGPTSRYLQMPYDEPVFDALVLAREGLRTKFRNAVHRVLKQGKPVEVRGVTLKRDDGHHRVSFSISPLPGFDAVDPLFLVTFADEEPAVEDAKAEGMSDAEVAVVHQLEGELVIMREELQSTIEEVETSNEALKANYEEMMSMNEELQSSNEELETSKEELSSLNEELNTVNAQLREKILDLESLSNDLSNLLSSAEIATIFVDKKLKLRRVTQAIETCFAVGESDLGRGLEDLSQLSFDPALASDARGVLGSLLSLRKEVSDRKGRFYRVEILPFRTRDDRIEGLVISFTDISRERAAKQTLETQEKKYRLLTENMSDLVLELDARELHFLYVSPSIYKIRGSHQEELIGQGLAALFSPDSVESLEYQLRRRLSGLEDSLGSTTMRVELVGRDGNLVQCELALSVVAEAGVIQSFVGSCRDITQRLALEQSRRESENRLALIFNSSPIGVSMRRIDTGQLIVMNPAFYAMLGSEPGDGIETRGLQGAWVGPGSFEDFFERLKRELSVDELEVQVRRKDGRLIHLVLTARVTEDDSGQLAIFFARDLSALRKAQTDLELSSSRFSLVFNESPIGIILQDYSTGIVVDVNAAFCTFAGHRREELVGSNLSGVRIWEHEGQKEAISQLLDLRTSFSGIEMLVRRSSGELRNGIASGKIIDADGGRLMISLIDDVTDQRRVERDLSEARSNYELLINNMEEGVAFHEMVLASDGKALDYKILRTNPAFENILGIDRNAVEGKLATEAYGVEVAPFLEEYAAVVADAKSWHTQVFFPPLSKHFLISAVPSGDKGFATMFFDVSERVRQEEALRNMLAEKETLLRELYHRTKNNMQVISALLTMRAMVATSEPTKAALRDVDSKIRTMALVHQKLYQSQDLSRIRLDSFVQELSELLAVSYDAKSQGIRFEFALDASQVLIDTAIPCGLVLNELITNSFKHAFAGKTDNTVSIALKKDDSTLRIEYRDNGRGTPSGFDYHESTTLGMQTIVTIVEHQLRGTIDFPRGEGFACTIVFKEGAYQARV